MKFYFCLDTLFFVKCVFEAALFGQFHWGYSSELLSIITASANWHIKQEKDKTHTKTDQILFLDNSVVLFLTKRPI